MEEHRKKFAEEFYSSGAWQTCRTNYAKSKAWTCERCGEAGAQVHHKIRLTPVNIHNPDVTLNWKNLEMLCEDCHKAEHKKRKKKKTKRYTVEEDGTLIIRCPPVEPDFKGYPHSNGVPEKRLSARARDPLPILRFLSGTLMEETEKIERSKSGRKEVI